MDPEVTILGAGSSRWRAWLKLLRIHQWAKNALVFVPLVTAQRFELRALGAEMAAFFAISLAASGVYILNDVVDIDADRQHPSKRFRPLAAGTILLTQAMGVAPVLVVAATVGALAIAPRFAAVVIGYVILTTAYTFVLKRKMMIDVVTLAALYTLRVIGGAVAISVPVSEWLLAFSMFMFASLALIKRHIELAARLDADLPDPSNRNYRKTDLDIVAMLATAAGFNAVTVFALYVSSETVRHEYRHPQILWLVCPVLMYWLGRVILMAHRRFVSDDPILFALTDRNSLVTFALVVTILAAAM